MENQTPTGLKQLFQSMCPEGPNIIEGIVTNVSPLQVALVNDAKMKLGENSLVVPGCFRDYRIVADIPQAGLEQTPIIVHNALKQGEVVYLLAFKNGKSYYLLDRKGG
jgi:Protein of unknown function (DUF2577).